jgi:hypothetical protein
MKSCEPGCPSESHRRRWSAGGCSSWASRLAAINDLITIVKPNTFAIWVRQARRNKPTRKVGRPRTILPIRDLVLQIAKETGWGYTRVLGELRKLTNRKVSRQTVVCDHITRECLGASYPAVAFWPLGQFSVAELLCQRRLLARRRRLKQWSTFLYRETLRTFSGRSKSVAKDLSCFQQATYGEFRLLGAGTSCRSIPSLLNCELDPHRSNSVSDRLAYAARRIASP